VLIFLKCDLKKRNIKVRSSTSTADLTASITANVTLNVTANMRKFLLLTLNEEMREKGLRGSH
jgi:hypothetical protein